MNIVKIEGLEKSFNGRKVLKNINFSMNKNDIVIIKGHSGAGKSTFLNILMGFIKADEGQIELFGRDITSFSEEEMAEIRVEKIGYMTQEDTIISALNVKDNINMPVYIKGEESKIDIPDYMNKFNLIDIAQDKKDSLSGGEKRKLMFLRSIVNLPSLLILDEPTSSLDSDSVKLLIREINKLSEIMSIMIVTHDDRISELGTKYVLEDGNLLRI